MKFSFTSIDDKLPEVNAESPESASTNEYFIVTTVAVATAAAGDGSAEESGEEEAADVDLNLAEVGEKKVEVIKAVRSITGLGLKDAKALVDGVPSTIKGGIPKGEAEEYAKQLEEAGAKVELK